MGLISRVSSRTYRSTNMPYEGGDMADGRKLFVGNLPSDISSKEIDDIFFKFGKISNIDVKRDSKKPFAFVEFEDHRDCEDAVKSRNNYNYDGYRLTVEFPKRRSSNSESRRSRPSTNDQGRSTFNKDHSGPSKRTDYRIIIRNLPSTGSWQDLKDFCREAGDVSFADVIREDDDRIGIVEFFNEDDMKYAVENLNDSKFKSHEGDIERVTIQEDEDGHYKNKSSPGYGASRRRDNRTPPPRRRSRSPPRRYRSRSRDRDYGRSSRRDRSRSRSPGYRRR